MKRSWTNILPNNFKGRLRFQYSHQKFKLHVLNRPGAQYSQRVALCVTLPRFVTGVGPLSVSSHFHQERERERGAQAGIERGKDY